MCVVQARIAGSITAQPVVCPGSGQALPIGETDRILIRPVVNVTPVKGLPVRSVLTERVAKPSGVFRQPQHSAISCCGSNTKMYEQILPVAVPGSVTRSVPSGAPAVWAFEK